MANDLKPVVGYIRQLAHPPPLGELKDSQLLERFAGHKDEAAFAVLVKRHGPLVQRVSRHVLDHDQDSEDVFQATFLVLARKAKSIRKKESVAAWLFGVAQRIARNVQRAAGRRRVVEERASTRVAEEPMATASLRELQAILDEETRRLPEKYRAPFILCCQEGKTKGEAAGALGLKEGTVSGRLARARQKLQQRLARRGIMLSAALSALAMDTGARAASAAMVKSTVNAAVQFVSSTAPASVAVSQAVLLARESLRSMVLAKTWLALVLILAATLSAAGAGALWSQGSPAETRPSRAEATEPKNGLAVVQEPSPPKMDLYGDPLPPGAIARLGSMRFRNRGEVRSVAWSPNGKLLGSAAWSDDVRLWNSGTGQLVRELSVDGTAGNAIAFSPDGGKLAAAGDQGMVGLWDTNTGKKLFQKRGHKGSVRAIVFSPDGHVFASAADDDGFVRVWDAASGAERWAFATGERPVTYHPVAISPDGRIIASGVGRKIFLWDLKNGARLRTIDTGQRRSVISLAFIDNEMLVAGGTRFQLEEAGKPQAVGEARFWNVKNGTLVRELNAPNSAYGGGIALSPDRKVLAVSHYDRLRLWSLADGKPIREITGYTNRRGTASQGLAFSPDGQNLAAATGDNAVHCWDWATGKALLQFPDTHSGWVCAVAFSPDGRQVLTGGLDGTVRLWDAEKARLIRSETVATGNDLPQDMQTVLGVAFSPDGKIMVAAAEVVSTGVAGRLTQVRFWNRATAKELSIFSFPNERVTALAFSANATTLAAATCSLDGLIGVPRDRGAAHFPIHLCNPVTRQVDRKLIGHTGFIHALLFPPLGKSLLSIADDGTVRLWDAAAGKQQARFPFEPVQFLSEIAVSPDGNWFASREPTEGKVVLRDLPKARERYSIQLKNVNEGESFVLHPRLAFSPDGRRLATVSYRNNPPGGQSPCAIHVWEVLTGQEVLSYRPVEAVAVTSLGFSRDGKKLISGMSNGTAFIWDLVTARHTGKQLEPAKVEQLWQDLGARDAALAYKAMWLLAGTPEQAVPFLRKHLPPAAAADPKRLAKLLTDLGRDNFNLRQKATTELEKLAEFAEPALRKTLQAAPSEEARQRVQILLKKLDGPVVAAQTLRGVRAVEVLERAATADSRRSLQDLARGAPEARLTQEARRVLERLDRLARFLHSSEVAPGLIK